MKRAEQQYPHRRALASSLIAPAQSCVLPPYRDVSLRAGGGTPVHRFGPLVGLLRECTHLLGAWVLVGEDEAVLAERSASI